MDNQLSNPKNYLYEIQVQGWLDKSWADWFDGLRITPGKTNDGTAVTFLTGWITDQVALRGILSRLWDLNLTLISVAQVRPPASGLKESNSC